MTRLYLVRHAHAGERGGWHGPDSERPLSDKGVRQSQALVSLLSDAAFSSVWSSPALRCVQTVEPLAASRSLDVCVERMLFEGHDPRDTMRWIDRMTQHDSLVACTHGDLVPALLDLAASRGCTLPEDVRWAKASTWVLDRDDAGWRSAAYLPPA